MRTLIATFSIVALLMSLASLACEYSGKDVAAETMNEERSLVLQALAKSDLVIVGKVLRIESGEPTSDPVNRVSQVQVSVKEILVGSVSENMLMLEARLHQVIVGCFGNETFWDDQVEVEGEYILFVADRAILSASPPAPSWAKLGLAGQREVVLSAIGGRR